MKVTKIIDHEFKTGTTTKNNKKFNWALAKIEVGDKEATGFGPVRIGDEVDLNYNQQYDNYQFKVLEPNEIPSTDINDDISGSGNDRPASASSSPTIKEPKAAADKFLKDISDTPKDIFKACLPYIDFNSLLRLDKYYDSCMRFIDRVSDDLMEKMQNTRSGEKNVSDSPKTGVEKARETRAKLKPEESEQDEEESYEEDLSEIFPED